MSNNIFLQLRERDAENTNANGDFTTKLQKPMVIEQGDEIIMNKCIIDSRAVDSGKILLEQDTQLTLHFNYYLMNYETTGKKDYAGNAWTANDVDGELYVLSQEFSHGSADVQIVTRIDCLSVTEDFFPSADAFITFEYKQVGTNNIIPYIAPLKLDPAVQTKAPFSYSTGTIALNAVKTAGEPVLKRLTTNTEMIQQFLDPNTLKINTTPAPAKASHWEPVVNNKEITILAGSYDPADIAEQISEKFTKLDTPTAEGFIDEPFGNVLLENTETDFYKNLNNSLFIRSDGEVNATSGGSPYQYKGAFQYRNSATNEHFFLGTSQFTCIYDEQTNRFKLSYTHFPYYNSSGELAVAMKPVQGTNTTFKLINKLGGILISGLTSSVGGVPTEKNFWNDKLGFNLSTLCVAPNHKEANAPLSAPVPSWTGLEETINLTGGEIGIDTTIDKTNIPQVPDLVNIQPTISAEQTLGINARGNFGIINLESGYFLVEIRGLNSELITNTDIKGHILGIVSRYYESENYTTGTDADAIVYRHYSPEPLYINELSVRILESNYNLANIGDDNTIFLQHVKAIKQNQEK